MYNFVKKKKEKNISKDIDIYTVVSHKKKKLVKL